MRGRTPFATLCVASGLFMGGCGDDDDEGLSKSAYIATADSICREGDRQINRAGEEFFSELGFGPGGEPKPGQIARFAKKEVVPIFARTIERLRELPQPEGDEATLDEIYAAADQGIVRLRRNPELVLEDRPSRADRLFAQYGIKTCGEEEEDED